VRAPTGYRRVCRRPIRGLPGTNRAVDNAAKLAKARLAFVQQGGRRPHQSLPDHGNHPSIGASRCDAERPKTVVFVQRSFPGRPLNQPYQLLKIPLRRRPLFRNWRAGREAARAARGEALSECCGLNPSCRTTPVLVTGDFNELLPLGLDTPKVAG